MFKNEVRMIQTLINLCSDRSIFNYLYFKMQLKLFKFYSKKKKLVYINEFINKKLGQALWWGVESPL